MSSLTPPCATFTDRRAVQSLASLCTIQTHLLEDGPLHGAFELICRFALDLTGADTSVIGIPSDRDQALEVSVTSTRMRARPAETLPGSDQGALTFEIDNVIQDVLETRAPAVLAAWSPGFSQDRLCTEPAPSMILPLGARGKRFGVLMLRRTPRDVPFASDDLHVVMSFVERALSAIDVERQRRRVHQQSILEDRQRIALDLHDVVVQRLYAAGVRLQTTSNTVASWRDGVDIQSSVGQIDTAIAELGAAIHNLGRRTTSATVSGQIHEVVVMHAISLGFTPTVALASAIESIPQHTLDELIPTLTEALGNVARHADATAASAEICCDAGTLTMKVHDNGNGGARPAAPGRGIANMQVRARNLGGSCTVEGRGSTGTSVIWTVPLDDGNQFDRFAGDWRRGNQTPRLPESNGHPIRRPSSSDSAQLLAPLATK